MKEKLLALLVAKFIGVPQATLDRIATKKAGSVTDESQIQSMVDGIDYGQIVQSEVDAKVTDANKKAVENYEAKHLIKDGKPTMDPIPPNPPATPPTPGSNPAIDALTKQMQDMANLLQGVVSKQSTEQKLTEAKGYFTEHKIPEKWLNRIDANSETPVKDQVVALKAEYDEFKQDIVNENIAGGHMIPKIGKTAETSLEDLVKTFNGENTAQDAHAVKLDV